MDSPDAANRHLPLCRALIRQRQLVTDLVGSMLCANPVWDMLLDLYVADQEGRLPYIWPLSVAGRVPISSAHRKIDVMVQHGLVVRVVDESDRRRVGIQLTAQFRERLELLFNRLMQAFHDASCS